MALTLFATLQRRSGFAVASRLSWMIGLAVCASICAPLPAQKAVSGVLGPKVTHTGTAPTGYAVTFRYRNAGAQTVRIRGEWSFERPADLPQLAATPDHPVMEGQGLLPKDWQPGDVPLQKPNSTAPNFPVAQMEKGRDGVWTFTTPLPSGVFTYSFFPDCPTDDVSKCKGVADPANAPWWNPTGDPAQGGVATNSQVFVPSDAAFHTIDYAWQAPAKSQGKLVHITYDSPGHVTPKDTNYLVIYTPPGYDAARAKAYPTLYLSHGGGENEMGWTTQGVAQNILDNLILTGQIAPLVVVMPNGSGYGPSTFSEAYDVDLMQRMIPYVESHVHVSHDAADRAFSGLSMGGMLTNSFLIKHPEVFRYYGMMSAGLPPANATLTPSQTAGLQGKSVWVGGGWQDVIHAAGFNNQHLGPAREVSTLTKAGIPVTTNFEHGGHEWYVWRLLLRDFLTRTAFLPAQYAAWQ